MKKLNLGCGYDMKNGWVNLDIIPEADVQHNLEEFPYPFKDNTFDLVYTHHVIEHIWTNPTKVIDELIRITKPEGKLEIIVPYYNAPSSGHYAHIRTGFNLRGFVHIDKFQYYQNGKLEEVKRWSTPTKWGKMIPNTELREFLSEFIGNLVYDVGFIYKVKKG